MTIYSKASVAIVQDGKDLKRILVLDDGRTYTFTGDWENLPKLPGRYSVSLSDNGDRLWNAFPIEGNFPVTFLGVITEKGTTVPRLFTNEFVYKHGPSAGKKGQRISIGARFKISAGEYAGLETTFFLQAGPHDLDNSNAGAQIRGLLTSILGPLWKTGKTPLNGGTWEEFILLLTAKQRPGLYVEVKDGQAKSFWMSEMSEPIQPPKQEPLSPETMRKQEAAMWGTKNTGTEDEEIPF